MGKDQCLLLKPKGKPILPFHAPAILCSTVSEKPVCVASSVGSGEVSGEVPDCVDLVQDSGFEPFIADAFVSLVGSDKHLPIKLLRDTGAKHSFVVESVLPFSLESATNDYVLMRGMEMGWIPVPRHAMELYCELVQGIVSVGVRPELPIEGVHMVLGNDLVGSRMPPPVVPMPC